MSDGFKKRPKPPESPKPPDPVAVDAFVRGAEPPATSVPAAASVPAASVPVTAPVQPYPWEASGVREDVIRPFNLRLSEPEYLQLKYIVEHGGARSMHQFALAAVRAALAEAVARLPTEDPPR
jgi:hypothetical protein